MNKYIVGIDPGKNCGYALISTDGELIIYGVLKGKTKWDYDQVISNHVDAVRDEIYDYTIDTEMITLAVIEGGFFSNNPVTSSKLSELRGALKYMFHGLRIPCLLPAPREVKKAFGGGNCEKEEIAANIAKMFEVNLDGITNDNITDAISMAYFGLLHTRKVN